MITLCIPTYNRLALWKTGWLLDSIIAQTLLPDELLICDDASTDGTCLHLPRLLEALPFPARLFRTLAPKAPHRQASALPDNVLFAHAQPSGLVIHADDDGWLDPNFVEHLAGLQSTPGVYFSRIMFHEPYTRALLYDDSRLKSCPSYGLTRIGTQFAWGASWCAPAAMLLELGGHDMALCRLMGSDSRLGWRLAHRLPAWFTADTVFHHLGPSYFQQLKQSGRHDEIRQNRRTPIHEPDYQPALIANGGAEFWARGLEGMFEEISQPSTLNPPPL